MFYSQIPQNVSCNITNKRYVTLQELFFRFLVIFHSKLHPLNPNRIQNR